MKRQRKCNRIDQHDIIFNKTFKFQGNHNWHLPSENAIFQANKWQISSLQDRKHKLNAVKEKLGQFDLVSWSLHTKKRDPSNQILKLIRRNYTTELLTQAWCKFYECISHMSPLILDVNNGIYRTLHLCEAPGGFISALNHFCSLHFPHTKIWWHATTLNPNYEGNPINRMIPDDRLIQFTKENWLFGADNTGDILKLCNYNWIIDVLPARIGGKLNLITADGSVDCMNDPSNQERQVEQLHYCEVITALTLLEKGGKFILKIFTTFEDSTVSLLYLLNCVFQSVTIIKPATSKSGNSETYGLCESYKGFEAVARIMPKLIENYEAFSEHKSLLPLEAMSRQFLEQIEDCAEFFMRLQISTITKNIQTYVVNDATSKDSYCKSHKKNTKIARIFLELYPIVSLPASHRLVKDIELKFNKTTNNRCSKTVFKYYNFDTNRKICLNIVCGKKLNQVLFSKFVHYDNLKLHLNYLQLHRLKANNVGKFHDKSLFQLCKHAISKILPSTLIIDCSQYIKRSQNEIHRKFFTIILQILKNFEKPHQHVLIINLGLLTNFLVGLLYMLSQCFCVFFFRNGILYLSSKNSSKNNRHLVQEMFQTIENAFDNLELHCCEFEMDLVELIECSSLDANFVKFVLFYNDNFC